MDNFYPAEVSGPYLAINETKSRFFLRLFLLASAFVFLGLIAYLIGR